MKRIDIIEQTNKFYLKTKIRNKFDEKRVNSILMCTKLDKTKLIRISL